MTQYEQLIDKDNFVLAYTRLKTAKYSEFKSFYYSDFKTFENFFESNIEQLISEVKDKSFKPNKCYKYYVPKKKNLARPFSLLALTDLIVYQAIANIVIDTIYEKHFPDYNNYVFGNIPIKSDENICIFTYRKWKDQWKLFKKKLKTTFHEGYEWIGEFDVASFFDTVDHEVLLKILEKEGIERPILDLLSSCLQTWVIVAYENYPFSKKCGLPQGPISSAIFSETLLYEVDKLIIKNCPEVTYIRYADDIRILSKTKLNCEKAVVYLDLICRDFSLIPQSEKVLVEKYSRETINYYIENAAINFSMIANESHRNKKLKEKSHNSLKKKVLDCLNPDSNNWLNKSIIKFGLYYLNKDEDVKEVILKNIDHLTLFLNEVVFYLDKFWAKDEIVNTEIKNLAKKDKVLYHYNISLIFEKFSNLEFDETFFEESLLQSGKFWIVKYRMILWLKRVKKYELILEVDDIEYNYFIEREKLEVSLNNKKDPIAKKASIKKALQSNNPLIALKALQMTNFFTLSKSDIEKMTNCNDYVKNIFKLDTKDFIEKQFKNNFGTTNCKGLIKLIKNDDERYPILKEQLNNFLNYKTWQPILALMNLDLFHNTLLDIIKNDKDLGQGKDFGSDIDMIKNIFPITNHCFKLIHTSRCEHTYAHYKDSSGKIIKEKIDIESLTKLITDSRLHDAYQELCKYYNK